MFRQTQNEIQIGELGRCSAFGRSWSTGKRFRTPFTSESLFDMKKPPHAETASTGVVRVLRSRGVFDQIVFARSELSSTEKGENVLGNYVIGGPDADTLQPARLNFVPGADGRCYAMPISRGEAAPHPEKRDGWLVLFVAAENCVGAMKRRTLRRVTSIGLSRNCSSTFT